MNNTLTDSERDEIDARDRAWAQKCALALYITHPELPQHCIANFALACINLDRKFRSNGNLPPIEAPL